MADSENSDLEVNHKKFQQTQHQLETIASEIRSTQALASDLSPIEELRKNYDAGSNFDKGILTLAKDYSSIRTIRGDGNCYYRAFLYCLCEKLFGGSKEEKSRLKTFCEKSGEKAVKEGGYDETAIEIFHESLVELIAAIVDGTATQAKVHTELLEENSTSDYCTWFMRVLTATHLKSDPNRFLPYLEDGYVDIHAFCQKQVEPMAVECTMVSVLALAEVFNVQVKIEYLDGHDISNDKVRQHQFGPEKAETSLTFLYRPGHYDILYPKDA